MKNSINFIREINKRDKSGKRIRLKRQQVYFREREEKEEEESVIHSISITWM